MCLVTRGYFSISWESWLHQPLFLSIKSDVLKFKCLNPLLVNGHTSLKVAADGVWSGLVASHLRLSDRCKQQSLRSECHTPLNSLSPLWIPLSLQKGCRAPFRPDKTGSHDLTSLSSFYFKHCLFCFLVCLSKCVWLVIFFFFLDLWSVGKFCDTLLKGSKHLDHISLRKNVSISECWCFQTLESTFLSSSDHASPLPNLLRTYGNKIVWPFPTFTPNPNMSKVTHPWG